MGTPSALTSTRAYTRSRTHSRWQGRQPRAKVWCHSTGIVLVALLVAFHVSGAAGECDWSRGKWVKSSEGPRYDPKQCTRDVNLQCKGKPRDYQGWRWQPSQCSLPQVSQSRFLNTVRGKRILLVGDSIMRNMFDALICILDPLGRKAVQEGLLRSTKHDRKFYFPTHNAHMHFVFAPFLTKYQPPEVGQKCGSKRTCPSTVFVNEMDELLASTAHEYHALVLGGGRWWDHYSRYSPALKGAFNGPGLKNQAAGRQGMATVNRALERSNYRNLVVWANMAPGHYQGGAWNSGGSCVDRSTVSIRTHIKPLEQKLSDAMQRGWAGSKLQLRMLDIMTPAGYRRDAHPGKFGISTVGAKVTDCIHWCLPGVPDVWNEMLQVE